MLVNGLDAAGVDWRLAVTTSDNGNPWCPPETTTPESGQFVFSSCKSRLGDFLFNNGDVNVQDLACNNICNLDDNQLQALPTTTDDDPQAKPRPWLQREGGQLNLPPGVDAGEALRCLVPMGINGCGFEQQLEAILKAVTPTGPTAWTSPDFTPIGQPGGPDGTDIPFFRMTSGHGNVENDGFLRENAVLAIIPVTDEEDCSVVDDDAYFSSVDTAAPNVHCTRNADRLTRVAELAASLLGGRDPEDVVFAAIAGIPAGLDPELTPEQINMHPDMDYEESTSGEASSRAPRASTSTRAGRASRNASWATVRSTCSSARTTVRRCYPASIPMARSSGARTGSALRRGTSASTPAESASASRVTRRRLRRRPVHQDLPGGPHVAVRL